MFLFRLVMSRVGLDGEKKVGMKPSLKVWFRVGDHVQHPEPQLVSPRTFVGMASKPGMSACLGGEAFSSERYQHHSVHDRDVVVDMKLQD